MQAVRGATIGAAQSKCVSALPALPKHVQLRSSVTLRACSPQTNEASTSFQNDVSSMPAFARQALIASTAATTLAAAGSAQAATELMDIAAGDNRASLLMTLFVPALGWVAFNILPGLKNQLDNMADRKGAVVGPAIGLTAASLLLAQSADAASEVAQVADNRINLLLTLFVPVLGWVAFNILPGLKRQLDNMAGKKGAVVGPAVGLGAAASLFTAQSADAASEVAQVADNRFNLLLTLFVPVLGWVAFNILPGLKRQLDNMADRKGAVVGPAIGLTAASLLLAQSADAASEVAQVADNRVNLLLTLFVPVLGWVAFNILPGLKRQLDAMAERK